MKYFIYCRKSTESEERQVLSLEAQLAELQEFAAKEKLEIVASFEEAKTAKEPGRTVFAEMIRRIENGEANGILAWHPDRLARNSIDGGQVVYLLDTGKLLDLKFPIFWFDNTPQGKFMLSISFGQSKYYVDNLSENIKRGNRQKLRKGLWPAFAPLGYLNNRKTRGIDPDPAKAEMVRKTYELYAMGEYTLKELATILEAEGLRSYRDNVLSVSSVQRLLQNPIYYGAIHFNGEAYQGVHEPIISKTTFDRVQQVMSNRGKKKRKRQHDYAFTGFMQCGNCDCAVTAEKQKGHVYYRCTKKRGVCDEKYLREELLAEQLQDMIQKVSLPDEWANNMLAELDNEEASDKLPYRRNSPSCKASRKKLIRNLIACSICNWTTACRWMITNERKVNWSIGVSTLTRKSPNWSSREIIGSNQSESLLKPVAKQKIPLIWKTIKRLSHF